MRFGGNNGNIIESLAVYNVVITAILCSPGNKPYWKARLATRADVFAMESDINFKLLTTISSLPGAPSLR